MPEKLPKLIESLAQKESFFGSVAQALDDADLGVVQEAIEERRGESGVLAEDLRPALERFVGCDGNGTSIISM